jgi:tRNA G10  N-methylase Trm11
LKNRSLVLLSGERSSLPEAEAKALFLAYDQESTFHSPEERVIVAHSNANPFQISSRIAFARRVGVLLDDPSDAGDLVKGKKVRLRNFDLSARPPLDPERILRGIDAEVDLVEPDFEFTLVRGREDYLALSAPSKMRQGWSKRRPRSRAFFHPSAMFPKLARALVNLSRCRENEVFFDPFAGTGSLVIEASLVGARAVGMDLEAAMAGGALSNMHLYHLQGFGVLRGDAFAPPLRQVDAISTDMPYGRASSTKGRIKEDVMARAVSSLPEILGRGSRLVLMHPENLAVSDSSTLDPEEEHQLYVHKLLTRTISVLRRR